MKLFCESDELQRMIAAAPEFMTDMLGGYVEKDGEILTNGGLIGFSSAKSVNKNDRTIDCILATNILDRYGEIVEPKGWKLKNFKRNPIVLWNHNEQGTPIGRALNIESRADGLFMTSQFAVEQSFKAAEVWALLEADFLRAWSPGWYPLTWEVIDDPKIKGEGPVPRRGIRFLTQELWEASVVNIPAAPNALTLSIAQLAIQSAAKFGISVPESELEGELGVISRGARLLQSCPDLEALLARHANDEQQHSDSGPIERSISENIEESVANLTAASCALAIAKLTSCASTIRALRA